MHLNLEYQPDTRNTQTHTGHYSATQHPPTGINNTHKLDNAHELNRGKYVYQESNF